jgi:hypothetical protein
MPRQRSKPPWKAENKRQRKEMFHWVNELLTELEILVWHECDRIGDENFRSEQTPEQQQ